MLFIVFPNSDGTKGTDNKKALVPRSRDLFLNVIYPQKVQFKLDCAFYE